MFTDEPPLPREEGLEEAGIREMEKQEIPANFIRVVVALDLTNGLLATGLSFWRSFFFDLQLSVQENISAFLQATGLTVSEARNTGSSEFLPMEQLSFYFQGIDIASHEAHSRLRTEIGVSPLAGILYTDIKLHLKPKTADSAADQIPEQQS